MNLSLKEGESVTLPCRHCASLSLEVVIRKGTTTLLCPKCGETVRLCISEGPAGGLELHSQGEPQPPVPPVPLQN